MIEVDRLTKVYDLPNGRNLVAVNEVSFRVAVGEVYGLLGPNGAGKTTTLRMLLGLLQPTGGNATIAGHSALTHPEEVKRRVGYVMANAGVYQHLSVREMLLFFADVYGLEPKRADERLALLSPLLGLTEILSQRCVTLSTGQKQRVNLARALIHNPPVMLLDEPTLGLDVIGSQTVVEYIAHVRGEGKAVIITTHRLDEAERLCDRFGLLHRGQLVLEGTLPELRERTGCVTLVEMFLKLAGMQSLLQGPASEHA